MLPFTADVFLAQFGQYNAAIWPAQIAAYGLGVAALALCLRPTAAGGRMVASVLALLWAWNAIAYHWLYFATINFLAPGFALLFLVQAILFAWHGARRGGQHFAFARDASGIAGLALALYALIVYPLTSLAAGHGWPQMPVFGVAPCPTTIFTLGLLLMARPHPPLHLIVVPLLWTAIGGSAAFLLGMVEDLALPASGLIALVVMVAARRRSRQPAALL